MQEKTNKRKDKMEDKSRGISVLLYVELTEKVARTLKKRSISTAAKPHITLRRLLVWLKDKVDQMDGCTP